VVGNNPAQLNTADGLTRARLQGLGYTVTVVGDAASTSADASGKQLVVISSTSFASNIGSKFRTTTVPIVTWEHALWDDLGMTAAAGTQVGGQTSLAIVTPGSPLAAGLSGTVAISTAADTLPQGSPNGNATIVARLPGTTTASDFGYDTGAAMPGLTAPARRVGLFLGDNTAATFTANGWALFDAAVVWARNQAGGGPSPSRRRCWRPMLVLAMAMSPRVATAAHRSRRTCRLAVADRCYPNGSRCEASSARDPGRARGHGVSRRSDGRAENGLTGDRPSGS
jgi:hypothetical protein